MEIWKDRELFLREGHHKQKTTERMKLVWNEAYFNISDYGSIREDCVNASHNLNNETELDHCTASVSEKLEML